MKRIECAQGSVEWLEARAGIPTASEFDNLITPKWEIRKGQTPKTYLSKKLAEKWLGGPLASFGSWATEQGQILQDECVPWYEFEFNCKVDRVGLITTDDGLAGCSPDGLIKSAINGADVGLEVKCLQPPHHVECLIDGELPDDFAAQVHGSMWVTGFQQWKFVAYRRKFPPLILTVARDEEIIGKIETAVTLFNDRLNRAFERLVELNGGVKPVRPPKSPGEVKFTWEQQQDDAVGVTP
jgi:hypothetical protein